MCRETSIVNFVLNLVLESFAYYTSESPEYKLCGAVTAKPSRQFLSSQQMSHTSCSSSHIPRIQAEQGQKINFTLVDLRPSDQRSQTVSFGVIVDESTQTQLMLTLDGQDERTIGVSGSNSVSLILDDIYNAPPFIIGYQGGV